MLQLTLPAPNLMVYDYTNEAQTRRAIEVAFSQVSTATAAAAAATPAPLYPLYANFCVFNAPLNGSALDTVTGVVGTVVGGVSFVSTPAPAHLVSTGLPNTASGAGAIYAQQTMYNLASNDFTIEGWFRTAQVQQYTSLIGRGSWLFLINNTAGKGDLALYGPGGIQVVTVNGGWADGQRHHVRVTRAYSTFTIFVDGVLAGSTTAASFSVWSVETAPIMIADDYNNNTRALVGTMDNWRILNGVALSVTKNFVVPTPPFSLTA